MSMNLEEAIRKSTKRYFKLYAANALSTHETDTKVKYVVANCMQRLKNNPKLECKAKENIDGFVLKTVFSCCISESARPVKTPLGTIVAYPKHHLPDDNASDYPGIFVDITNDKGVGTMLACIEYIPPEDNTTESGRGNILQACVYGNCADDSPTDIRDYTNVSSAFDE